MHFHVHAIKNLIFAIAMGGFVFWGSHTTSAHAFLQSFPPKTITTAEYKVTGFRDGIGGPKTINVGRMWMKGLRIAPLKLPMTIVVQEYRVTGFRDGTSGPKTINVGRMWIKGLRNK